MRWNGILGIQEDMDLRGCNLHSDDAYLGLRCFRMVKPQVERILSGYILSSQEIELSMKACM